jgi:hypothetical protein
MSRKGKRNPVEVSAHVCGVTINLQVSGRGNQLAIGDVTSTMKWTDQSRSASIVNKSQSVSGRTRHGWPARLYLWAKRIITATLFLQGGDPS